MKGETKMTLKQFEKVNSEVVTEYRVFTGDNRCLDDFMVDFLADMDTLHTQLQKLRKLETDKTAKVAHVTVNSCTHNLTVSVHIN